MASLSFLVFIISFSMPLMIYPLSTQEYDALIDLSTALSISGWDPVLNSDPCQWSGVSCNSNGNVSAILLQSKKLEGSIPSSIGNFSSLAILHLYNNKLTGTIPASIGHLTSVLNISLGTNHLEGSIPHEIGNMVSLRSLRFDNNNLTGPIPSSIGNLTRLEDLVLGLNGLTSSIPTELGNLKNLTRLWLYANNLSGEIPDSFKNLSGMVDLILAYNSLSGSVSFVENLPALERLWLQRNQFSGPLPNFSSAKLWECDLGFNKFNGSIPASLALPNLKRLLLGHNHLQGSIPAIFGNLSSLSILDVSHNSLLGSTTHLVNVSEKDLSFNYFEDQVGFLSLNCNSSSAKDEPCSPSSTGSGGAIQINIGGSEITFDNKVFQADSANTTTGLHQIGSTSWLVEISGLEGQYTSRGSLVSNKQSQTGVYATARWSSNYIAYHGTQLANGNYSVTLYFEEMIHSYVNYRAFDVVVQGTTVLKNLDLVAQFGSYSPKSFIFNASVSSGTLSVELIANRYNIWNCMYSGPIISAISVTPLLQEHVSNHKNLIVIGVTVGAVMVLLLLGLIIVSIRHRWCTKSKPETEIETTMDKISKIGPFIYTYDQLLEATDNFNQELLLGKGGFGAVYKGTLADGSIVAVKHLTQHSKKNMQIFKKEIVILSMLQHKNLVMIKGYCLDSKASLLVCDYIENGSLDKVLFKGPGLDWPSRRKVAIGAACGLQYLHEESRYHVIHCDVKPANILLDKDMNAYVADFGLAKFFKENEGIPHIVVDKGGTAGYMAPEYVFWNELSEKVDVYSFGIVLFVLLTGKRINSWDDSGDMSSSIVRQAQELAYAHPPKLLDLVDEKLNGTFDEKEALDMSIIALLCTQESPDSRPSMRDAWLMLTNTIEIPPFPKDTRM